MSDIDREIELILDNHAIAYSRNTMKVIKGELPRIEVLDLNKVDRQTKAQILALINEAKQEERYAERFRILNTIQSIRLDVSGEAIKNGRVNIMPYIAKRLSEHLGLELKQGKTQ